MREFPDSVCIETINTCNARCPFCPLFQGNSVMDRKVRPAVIMSDELFDQIVSEVAAWETKPSTIWLNMNGEPLQDPHFAKRLAAIRSYRLGALVNLQTNGQFLSEEMAGAILDAGVCRLTVGFDGATPATYSAHRVRCDFDRVLGNIRRFATLRDAAKSRTGIAIQYVRTKQNEHEVLAAYEIFNAFLDPDLDTFQDNLAKDWGDKPAGTGIFYVNKYATEKIAACQLAAEQMVISSDGVLAACCWDYNLSVSDGGLGNVAAGLLATWRGPKRRKVESIVTNGLLNERPTKCQTCVFSFEVEMIDPALAKITGPLSTLAFAGFIYRFARPEHQPKKPATIRERIMALIL